MLAAFLMTSFFSGLGHDNTILTGHGVQVFLLLLLKGSDKWMKVELTAFHWRLYSFFLTNRFTSWRHLWNRNSPTLDRPRRAVLQRNYLSQLLTPLQQVLQAPLQAAANVHTPPHTAELRSVLFSFENRRSFLESIDTPDIYEDRYAEIRNIIGC